MQVAGPLITAAAIDLYLRPEPGASAQKVLHFIQALHLPSMGGAGLATLAALFLVSVLGSAVLLILQARTMLMTGQLVMRDLRDALFAHLQKLEVAWFSRTPAGRIITRLTNDVEALNELFTSGLVDILADLALLGGIAGILFSMDWRLALVAFAVLPFMILLSAWFRSRARSIYREVRSRIAAINTHLQEHLAGMSVVQLARAEARTSASVPGARRVLPRRQHPRGLLLRRLLPDGRAADRDGDGDAARRRRGLELQRHALARRPGGVPAVRAALLPADRRPRGELQRPPGLVRRRRAAARTAADRAHDRAARDADRRAPGRSDVRARRRLVRLRRASAGCSRT